jgi:hypothetical protein
MQAQRQLLPLFAMSVFLLVGCAPSPGLDPVARSVEEYGTVSVSAPMLVEVDKAQGFAFDLDKSATFYYDAARVEGAVRLFTQEAFDLQLAFRLQLDQLMQTLSQLKASPSAAERSGLADQFTAQLLKLNALSQMLGYW